MRNDNEIDLGSVKINRNIILEIIARAVGEDEGIRLAEPGFLFRFFCRVKNRPAYRIEVEVDKKKDMRINIDVVISYGIDILKVADTLRERINAILEKMIHRMAGYINVRVVGIKKEL